MRFVDLLAMSLNNLRRRKLRTVLTVLGVIIGTAAIVVMMSLGVGLKELNKELIESYGSLTAITVRAKYYRSDDSDPTYLTEDSVKDFKRLDHVTSVYPMLEYNVILKQGKYETSVTLIGAPQEYLEQIPLGQGQLPDADSKEMQFIYGNMIQQWFSDEKGRGYWETGELPDVDFMGKPMYTIFDTSAYYDSKYGEGKAPKKYLIETAGVVEGDINTYSEYSYSVYTRLDLLEAQLKKIFKKKAIPGQPTNKKGKPYSYFVYDSCVVNVDATDHVTEVQQQLTDMGFQAYSNVEWMEQSEKQSGMIQMVLGGIGAVSLFVAAIGIANTMMMSIYERTKEIGVIKVLGCDMREIRNMFLIESGCIGFMGGVIGVAFSYGVSIAMNQFLNLGQAMTGQAGDISRIPLWLSLSAIGFAIVMGMIAGFFPALRAMKLSPLAAIRNE